MVEVVITNEFETWFENLTETTQEDVAHGVDLLEARGVSLGHPYSSAIKGSKYPLRELRIQSAGRPIRVFYAFDPRRQAVLILAGDKTGDDRFYERFVPRAEARWEEYLSEIGSA